jgi:hypothetical protein
VDACEEGVMNETSAIHPFERSNLGIAPFRFVGFEVKLKQAIPGDPSCPVKPGASCDYCATAIANVYWIKSSDGKTFKVGSECVRKTGDKYLIKKVTEAESLRNRKAREAKGVASAADVQSKLADPWVRSYLSTLRHPCAKWKPSTTLTMLDYFEWVLRCSGTSGKVKLSKMLNEILKEGPL